MSGEYIQVFVCGLASLQRVVSLVHVCTCQGGGQGGSRPRACHVELKATAQETNQPRAEDTRPDVGLICSSDQEGGRFKAHRWVPMEKLILVFTHTGLLCISA